MLVENITISNLNCGGCIKTITKKLTSIVGVNKANIDLESNNVMVYHNDKVSRQELTEMLMSIGYPEATAENGLLTQLKGIGSCLIGKIS
jgi:copper chaperone CopZ